MFKKLVLIGKIIVLLFYFESLFAALVDPTAPMDYTAEESSKNKEPSDTTSFVLSAILISENNKLAVINDNVVRVGDKVGDEEVKSIEQYQVKLVGSKGELKLRLIDDQIKETAK